MWNQKTDEAFVILKKLLTNEPLLQYPDFTLSTINMTEFSPVTETSSVLTGIKKENFEGIPSKAYRRAFGNE